MRGGLCSEEDHPAAMLESLETAHSSSLSSVASGGELENTMGLFSAVEKVALMSSPWPDRAA